MSLFRYLSNPRTQRVLTRKPGEKGFSLIELVVVIAMLAVLIVIALPNFKASPMTQQRCRRNGWLMPTPNALWPEHADKPHHLSGSSINGGLPETTAVTCQPQSLQTHLLQHLPQFHLFRLIILQAKKPATQRQCRRQLQLLSRVNMVKSSNK